MSKAPATKTPAKTKAQPEAPPLVVGKFSFPIMKGLVIPDAIPRAPSAVELPFKAMFGEMEHNDSRFVPDSFWTGPKADGGRGVAQAKLTSSFVRGKIRGAFNEWVKKAPEERAQWGLILVPRKAGDADGLFTESGMSFFLVDKRK